MGPAQPRQDADGGGLLHRRLRRSGDALTHRSGHGGISAAPAAQSCGILRSDADRSWLWVLFWGKDSPVGIMGLCSQLGYEYSSNDENLLVAISRQLATTIEKVRLYEETCRAYEDLRKTQEQLLQSEKISAVGQLIAGVAHELNNPLTAILGY